MITLLAEAIKTSTSLKKLYLHKCKLRTEYILELFDSLKANKMVTEIKLINVHLLPAATAGLSQLLSINHNIKRLIVKDCAIDDKSMADLAHGILESPELELIDLRNNIFEDLGLKILIESLKNTGK
jgi:Ran GTPase-activating protein (RanGAP) involved in mRNA processing and transport